jgi:hypothetical protein
MSDKKYTITRRYKLADGTPVERTYNWKKYKDYHCEICHKDLSYSSKTKHIKSKGHLRLKKYVEELEELKKAQETKLQEPQEQTQPQEAQEKPQQTQEEPN